MIKKTIHLIFASSFTAFTTYLVYKKYVTRQALLQTQKEIQFTQTNEH